MFSWLVPLGVVTAVAMWATQKRHLRVGLNTVVGQFGIQTFIAIVLGVTFYFDRPWINALIIPAGAVGIQGLAGAWWEKHYQPERENANREHTRELEACSNERNTLLTAAIQRREALMTASDGARENP